MDKNDIGNFTLTMPGLSYAAAKRIAEDFAGAMVWVDGRAYPTTDDRPFTIIAMTPNAEVSGAGTASAGLPGYAPP